MSPFKSSAGRALGKMLEGFKSSDIGKGFGAGSAGPFSATGGSTVTAPDGKIYHVFTHPGDSNDGVSAPFVFEASGSPGDIEFIIVGGGGGGGWDVGGGGAGGGVVISQPATRWTVDAGSYTVTVGQGGDGGNGPEPNPGRRGSNGGSSSITLPIAGTITAMGGGGGGGWISATPSVNSGAPGANGGGHCGWQASGSGGSGNQLSQNPGISGISQYGGYTGGSNPSPSTSSGGGGGAGAGGNGGTGGPPNVGGTAGIGIQLPAWYCSTDSYAPLLPSAAVTVIGTPGNFCPGAAGIAQDGSTPGPVGADGSGQGGGAGGSPNTGKRGGHGVVIIRYPA